MSQAIHPLIGQLIRYMEKVDQHILNGNWFEALKTMQLLHLRLKPTHHDEKLKASISEKINQIQQTRSRSKVNGVLGGELNLYKDWWSGLQAIIWDNKYLEMDTYKGFYDPSGGKQSPK